MLAAAVYVLWYYLQVPGWVYGLLLLGPDISMLGYLAGNRVGAWTYNLFHHKAVALCMIFAGLLLHHAELQITGLVMFGHTSMDRIFGFGLKYEKGFGYTHLGTTAKQNV